MDFLFRKMTPERKHEFVENRRMFQFLAANRTPILWLDLARRHKRAADIIYEMSIQAFERYINRFLINKNYSTSNSSSSHILEGDELADYLDARLISEYYLLVGYALECLLKGYLLALTPDLVSENVGLDKKIRTHKLCKLCGECAIELTPDEKELLDLVSRYIIWGKYPTPTKLEDMPSFVDPEDDRLKSLWDLGNPFIERRVQKMINEIFKRIWILFTNLNKLQPDLAET